MSVYTGDDIVDYVFTDSYGEFGAEGKRYDLNSIDPDDVDNIGYSIVHKESYEEELIQLIAEKISVLYKSREEIERDRRDVSLMKADLKKLMSYDDEFIFLSINDNEFLIKTECDQIESWYKKQGSKESHNEFDRVLGEFIKALNKMKLQKNDSKRKGRRNGNNLL